MKTATIGRRTRSLAIAAALVASLAACGGGGDTGPATTDSVPTTDADPGTVTLVAYDAFTPAEGIFDEFTKQTGAAVKVVTGGDSGAVVNKAILTAGNPEGDVLWGIDNTTLARAQKAKVLDSYEAVDQGDVCINYSKSWYAKRKQAPPASLDDLVKPEYKDQLVVEDPVASSPGLNFLLATIAKYGDGWKDWWSQLKDNGVKVAADWTTAWTMDYAGAGSPGDRPLVVSYGSSPPAEIVYADPKKPVTEPDSGVIESTCFRQTEYTGVLRGSKNPNNARALVDYLLGKTFQESMPTSLFVFPVNRDAVLPEVFTKWAVQAADPLTMDAAEVESNVKTWLDDWRALIL